MKKYIVFGLLMFTAISTNNVINADDVKSGNLFPILNDSGKRLIVQAEIHLSKYPYFQIAKPGDLVIFTSAGWLARIKVVILDDALLKALQTAGIVKNVSKVENGKNVMSYDINNDKLLQWLETPGNAKKYPRITATIFEGKAKRGSVFYEQTDTTFSSCNRFVIDSVSTDYAKVRSRERGGLGTCGWPSMGDYPL